MSMTLQTTTGTAKKDPRKQHITPTACSNMYLERHVADPVHAT